MKMPTAKQIAVLKAIRYNQYGAFNGAANLPVDYVFDDSDFVVWSGSVDLTVEYISGLPKGKALSGVVSTLVQAGLLGSDRECVWLTKAGFDALNQAMSAA